MNVRGENGDGNADAHSILVDYIKGNNRFTPIRIFFVIPFPAFEQKLVGFEILFNCATETMIIVMGGYVSVLVDLLP